MPRAAGNDYSVEVQRLQLGDDLRFCLWEKETITRMRARCPTLGRVLKVELYDLNSTRTRNSAEFNPDR